MKYWVLDQIFNKCSAPQHLEYLEINQDFNILDTSEGVQQFADCPDEVIEGKDVRLGFPELIGLENILIDILQGEQDHFELKGIARFSEHSPLYINLYVIGDENEQPFEKRLIILFEDVTEKMVLAQTLMQRENEASLSLSALAASQAYIDKVITFMADALLVTTASGNIKTVNRATQDLFGYRESELISQPIALIITDTEFLQQVSCLHPLSQRKLLKNVEVVCQTKTGEEISVAFSCSAIQTDIEDLQDFVYIGRESTSR